jgi:16S rRNA (cytidine1402-2'-O)-methyltransferase
MPGSLVLVATPIGNLEDITLRALRALKEADLIAAEDTRRTARLLGHYNITTPTTSLHEHNERGRLPGLLARVKQGLRLAIVSDAGMPTVSDPGFLAVRAARDEGIPVEVVPGVSALTMALAGAGLPTDTFTFLGFAPSRQGERLRWLEDRLTGALGTAVLFEAPGRLARLLQDVHAIGGDRFVVVAHELTKLHESWHRGWLSDLLAPDAKALPDRGEFVVLVSDQKRTVDDAAKIASDAQVIEMFERLQRAGASERRETLAAVAGHFGLSRRDVYSIIEKYKSSAQ